MKRHKMIGDHLKKCISVLCLSFGLLSGCLTDQPDYYDEYSSPYGVTREVGWRTELGTFAVRHQPSTARLEDERPRPEDPSVCPMERSAPEAPPQKSARHAPATAKSSAIDGSASDTNAMARAILGTWTIDKDATMQANAIFPHDIRDALRLGLETNPFDLNITNGVYISRGNLDTIENKYEVVSVRGDRVTLRLTPVRGGNPRTAGRIVLTVKQGRLLFDGPDGLVLVMKRPSAQTPDAAGDKTTSRPLPL